MPLVPKRKVHEEQLRQRKEEAERQPPSARRMRTMRFAPWCSPTASTRPCSGLTAPIGPAISVANWADHAVLFSAGRLLGCLGPPRPRGLSAPGVSGPGSPVALRFGPRPGVVLGPLGSRAGGWGIRPGLAYKTSSGLVAR